MKYPKIGIFKQHTSRYILPEGWQYDIQELTVTGKDEMYYYYQTDSKLNSIHKDYFVRFKEQQLSLF